MGIPLYGVVVHAFALIAILAAGPAWILWFWAQATIWLAKPCYHRDRRLRCEIKKIAPLLQWALEEPCLHWQRWCFGGLALLGLCLVGGFWLVRTVV